MGPDRAVQPGLDEALADGLGRREDERRKTRQDNGSYMSIAVRRPIIYGFDGILSYYGTINGSNIERYDYDRYVLALEVRYSF